MRATLTLCALLAASAAMAQDSRSLNGTLTYLPRIALSDSAETVVELRDAFDLVVAEARHPTQGRQVPLPFTIEAPAGIALRVQAGISEGAEMRWVSQGLRVAAEGRDDLGELVLKPHQPMGFASAYRCGDRLIRVGHSGARMVMDDGQDRFALVPAVTASGAKYDAEDGRDSYFWEHQGKAMVRLDGVDLPECRVSFPIGSHAITARGNEPFWSVRAADGMLTLDRMTEGSVQLLIAESRLSDEGDIILRSADSRAALTLRNEICRDTMTGMPYPESAELAFGSEVLTGCAGDSLDFLVGRVWQITEIAGDNVMDASRAEIGFDRDGGTFGTGGCNRFMGGYSLSGEGLAIGTLGSTMMACAEDLMAQDAKLFDTLAQVSRFDIDAGGGLVLLAGDTTVLRAEAGGAKEHQ